MREFLSILLTFSLTVFAWIFFRSASISHAFSYIYEIFSNSLFTIPQFDNRGDALMLFGLICVFIVIEWIGREHQYAIQQIVSHWKRPFQFAVYYLIIIAIFWFGGKDQQFIYFQF